ncbi:acyl-CoA dehydrogenase family member 11 [Bufo gargarizans]|uniref:acyl-CoA dehydrogenase family member 11 n=1 Tax=Bufo gargarizans TaxID=30331 RepID=UPI001CF2569D|nr:acyl-CoA dehydrogenase family member 11 [Bufo gargarizans]
MEADTSAVRDKHKFDEHKLNDYLSSHLPGFSSGPSDVLTVRQYRSGQSNPTFFLLKGQKKFVLRKKPHGPLLPGAHRIEREYEVQKALFSNGFPVPRPLLYCTDVTVIGTEFYVMDHVQGRIFRDVSLPDVSPAERSALYVALSETLAQLHSFDIRTLNLTGYGKGKGYCQRQVNTWKKQYERAAHRDVPAMNQLADWLISNVPSNDNEETLIHGDFRIDNIIFHQTEARVIAVLDWELSTIGHPMSDLAYCASPYFWPRGVQFLGSTSSKSFADVEGMPAFEDLINIYSRCRGISSEVHDWNFFLALTFFKLAGILQGIHARFLLGNSSGENASIFADMVQPLAENGLRLAKREQSAVELPNSPGELFLLSAKGQRVLQQVKEFLQQHVFPAQQEILEYYTKHENSPLRWKKPLVVEKLKELAKAEGLWNLFLPAVSGLSQTDYAFIAEETGKHFFAPEIFNCQAPDTGNMEVLHMYGTEEQKKQWLEPLLAGEIQSCFCMTEPDVASSDATNMECSIKRDGDSYIVNGKKWWSSGAGNFNCKIAIVMGKTDTGSSSRYKKHSMILVPMDTKGVEIIRALKVFGYEDTHHGGHFEVHFNNVRVPVTNLILGEGRGFEIAQGRLGPGRIHHCMRTIGAAESALQLMCARAAQRTTFGKKLYHHEVVAHWIAESRIAIEQARLLTLRAAKAIDTVGSARARKEIAMIKVVAPRMACQVADRAIQVFGGAGVCQDFPLAFMYTAVRTLRIADGPDEVHLSAIARMELMEQAKFLSKM